MDNIYLMVRMQCWQVRIASKTSRLPFLMKGLLQALMGATMSERLADHIPRGFSDYFNPQMAVLPMAVGMSASPVRSSGLSGACAQHEACRMLGGRSRTVRQSGIGVPRLFWDLAPFRDWLSSPLTEELYAVGAFQRFIEPSREPRFSCAGHELTLELVARSLTVAG